MELKSRFFRQLVSDFLNGFIKKKTKLSTLNIFVEECGIGEPGGGADELVTFKVSVSGVMNKDELKKLVAELSK